SRAACTGTFWKKVDTAMPSELSTAASDLIEAMASEAMSEMPKDQALLKALSTGTSDAPLDGSTSSAGSVQLDPSWSASKHMAVSMGYDPEQYDRDFPA